MKMFLFALIALFVMTGCDSEDMDRLDLGNNECYSDYDCSYGESCVWEGDISYCMYKNNECYNDYDCYSGTCILSDYGNYCDYYYCPDMMCEMYCENGFKTNEYGCEICECNDPVINCDCYMNYDPVCGANNVTYTNDCFAACDKQEILYRGECENNICPDVMCYLYCENGFKKDENGCETCECNDPVVLECGGFVGTQCPKGMVCEYYDNSAEIGRCVEKPLCDHVECEIYCENGFKKDENGCETCECNDPVINYECKIDDECAIGEFCLNGFCKKINTDGCLGNNECPQKSYCVIPFELCVCNQNGCSCPERGVCIDFEDGCYKDNDCEGDQFCRLPENCSCTETGCYCNAPGKCMPKAPEVCLVNEDCLEAFKCEYIDDCYLNEDGVIDCSGFGYCKPNIDEQ